MSRPRLVCLLPVRNGEGLLPGWFESVERFADAVVALDDGSTDATGAILHDHPLVETVLSNPVRPDYRGWDDAANRTRLLESAAGVDADWVLSLDADERIDPDDAAALRSFVDADALPGLAYGFRVFRMIDGLTTYDRAGLWVYRLFAYEPRQRLPDARLHFVPVPTSIPRQRWLRTTIRIQHLASLTDEHRRRRFEKYSEADSGLEYQADYSDLLAGPGELHLWEPRPPDLPVLQPADTPHPDGADVELDGPTLSAVIISRDDESTIAESVASVVEQRCPEPFEVIVVTSGTDRTAEIVRERFPEVTLIDLDHPALPGEARNAGVRAARGLYVSFPGSHVVLPPGSLAARMRAHHRGYPMVTGSVLNGTLTCAGWASYFLDHSASLPGRPSAELGGAPAHCSYDRGVLLESGLFPEDKRAGEDTAVNTRLFGQGYMAYRDQDIRLYHRSPCRTPWRLVRHHFTRGRALGRLSFERAEASGRQLLTRRFVRRMAVDYVPDRLRRTRRNAEAWGGTVAPVFGKVRPLVVAGSLAAWAGAWFEVLRPARGKARVLLGRKVAKGRPGRRRGPSR